MLFYYFFSYLEVGYLRFSISYFDDACNIFDGLPQRTMTHNVRTKFSISCFDDAWNLFDALPQRTMTYNVLTKFSISCFDHVHNLFDGLPQQTMAHNVLTRLASHVSIMRTTYLMIYCNEPCPTMS